MFKIEITETHLAPKRVGGEWRNLGDKEVSRVTELGEEYFKLRPDESLTRIAPVHGYTPVMDQMLETETVRLVQNVDSLDLKAVIRAINNLSDEETVEAVRERAAIMDAEASKMIHVRDQQIYQLTKAVRWMLG